MNTQTDEIADGIFRFSTLIPISDDYSMSFNQFLIDAEEPLLYHCGMRGLFPLVSEAVATVTPLERLRWISFGHVEADECGSMNEWLRACPEAQVVHGGVGCMVSIEDMADRPPRALGDGETLDLGGRRVQLIETPHVPHAWEAIMLFETATSTLFAGDLGSNDINDVAITGDDLAPAAIEAERAFPNAAALSPTTGTIIRRLAALDPSTVAIMHGASYQGDGGPLLRALADGYDDLRREQERES